MKCVCVIDECAVILCPRHAWEFEQAAIEAEKDCMIMELEDSDVGYVECAACEVQEKLNRIVNPCH